MKNNKPHHKSERRGSVIVLVALLMVPLLAMVAFAVDYGYILKVRTDLQRTADAAVLAAVQNLIPAADGSQDLAAVRSTLRTYATSNTDNSFQVLDADIEIGRYNPATIYSNLEILNTGTFDTVRATVRYDSTANSSVSLFFSRALGINQAPVTATATAVLQKAKFIGPGADVLPFAIPLDVWEAQDPGDTWNMYGDGKLTDSSGNEIPGNWGTLDIGPPSNGTSELNKQILNGLTQSDLDALYAEGRITDDAHIDGNDPTWINGDPGLSQGLKQSIQQIYGETRLVPIYDALGGPFQGNNVEFQIVGWGVVEVVTSNWGGNDTYVTIQKAYMYDGDLRPQPDLSETSDIIEDVYTSPALVE